jgi:hypothetical protein
MKRKVRKYVEGGFGDDDYERNENRAGRMSTLDPSDIEDAIRGRQMAEAYQGVKVEPVAQRSAIRSTNIGDVDEMPTAGFSRTPIKSAAPRPMAAKPATPKPATQPLGQSAGSMGRTAMSKTVAQEMSAIEAGRKAAGKADLERRMAYDKPLERVNPEASLIGGPALRGLRAAGAGLASKMAPKKPEADFYYGAKSPKMAEKPGAMTTKPPRGGEVARGSEPKGDALATKSGQLARRGKDAEQLEMPKRRLPYEKFMGEAEVVKRPVQKLTNQTAKRLPAPPRGGGKDPGARRPTQDELDEIRMGSDYMRKGGKVGSASKRADGIATRGKTRGRYI